ncbi:hypothetical protein VAWG001_13670 [Aeromonas dhakensis]|uniref:hypothetical protein n=1 Tax=Aeromonas dhakensis TaxID=196024 RepID=UPI002B29DCFC|nr:hypothetical protein VAWG001_13670 [Aeromonas dhakensis]
MSNKANKNNKDIFAVNEFKAVPSSMFEATRMQYVSADGEIVEIQISSDFKMIYSYLYDQQRSFAAQKGVDGEPQEMYQDWEYIFSFIGRKYKGDKNSMKIVKDLEASGLLIQTKRPNSTSTVKTVLDVTTIPTIKFSNAKHAECVNGAAARRTARQEQYAAAKKAKLAAIEEVKKRHQNNDCGVKDESGNEAKVDTVEVATNSNSQGYRNEQIRNVGVRQEIKQDDLPDPFLDDCGVSHDSGFEEYSQPKTIKSVKPKDNAYDNGYGRKCSQCYQQPNGDWDCRDSYCDNYLPF